jgi:EAL and modified HD-GYP domain-containing signal transduction protein
MSEVFVARQPIYNRTQHVYGYELLYRSDSDNQCRSIEGDVATSQLILNAVTDMGLDNLVGSRPAFINLSHGFLVGKYQLPLPSNRVVIEVLENVEIDDELIAGVRWLANQGYTIALDDFVYSDESIPLLKIANIVKLDVQALTEAELRDHVGSLRQFEHLKLLAEKIEITEEYQVCRELGFDFFQGYFFSRPKIIKRRRLPANQLALMQLLAELQQPDVTVPKMETLISRDIGLSYKLLRYINSAFFGLPKQIESIQRAIVFLGTNIIQKWATLLVLARVDDKPSELMVTAVVRAKMCEMLAQSVNYQAEDTCFTIGLLSVLDALLDMPMEKIISSLSLSEEINKALLAHEGVAGEILDLVLHYELSEWDQLKNDKIDELVIRDAYLQSVVWATEACQVLVGD